MMKNQKVRKKTGWLNYTLEDKIFTAIVYAFIIFALFVCIYPLYYTIIASFSAPYAVYGGKVVWWIKEFTTKAYEMVIENEEIWRGYANSIYYTAFGTAFCLFLTIPAAYALSKKRMLGRSFLMGLFLFTMYFGGGMVPNYILIKNLGLLNTRLLMIINGGLSVYNLIVTRTFFQNNIPDELYEAARIDGSSELSIFTRIALPLSKPIIAVMALYYGVGRWSSYFSAMIYLNEEELQPLQVVLRRILILSQQAYDAMLESDVATEVLQEAAYRAQMALTMKYAVVFIASAPMLIAYPFVQKYFVKGVMIGSLKG